MENFKSISSLEPFSFPLKSQGNLSYFDTLKKTLRLFEKLVSELKESDSVTVSVKSELQGLKDSNKKILKVISSYLEGNSGKAYKTLDGLLKSPFYKSKLNSLLETLSEKTELLRVRISLEPLVARDQMFHIPFSKRHLVANQRFSIAGLPCLYLGSSIYVCWLELGRKDFGGLWISGFRPNKSLKVLNLAYDLDLIINQFHERKINEAQFVNMFLLWPLVMASCFQVKHPQAPFHEEYIISSLLLQWVKSQDGDIKGLKYLSTKLETYEDPFFGINYVFPPEAVTKSGFCENLVNYFELTNPLSWELISLLPPIDMTFAMEAIKAKNIEELIAKNYKHTRFGYIEQQVFGMAFSDVESP